MLKSEDRPSERGRVFCIPPDDEPLRMTMSKAKRSKVEQ
jgi:hypothetical protein